MKVELWDIEKVIPYPKNARKIPQSAITKVANSIQEFGWRQPIVVDDKGVIIAGHTRLLAAKSLNMVKVPVHVATDLTVAQIRAYRLADNRTNQEASWDLDLLAQEMVDLRALDMDFDLSLTGFDPSELDSFLIASETPEEDQVPAVPVTPVSRRGDLWLLGAREVCQHCGEDSNGGKCDSCGKEYTPERLHRLLCGDATSAEDVELLMDGQKADMIFTDPPYNVDIKGETKEKLKIINDNMSAESFRVFLLSIFTNYRNLMKAGASMYVCHSSSWQREFQNAMEAAGFEVRCQIIWVKNTFAWGFGRYKFQHEPIFYAYVEGKKDAWYGDKSQATVWTENKPSANRLHPTMKPVELVQRAVVNSSKAGDLLVDLFGGAGSTLICAEKTGRTCYSTELDPKYADVICQRYLDYAKGKTVMLAATGQTFDEVKAERVSQWQGASETLEKEIVA